jgi:hypothetical protein
MIQVTWQAWDDLDGGVVFAPAENCEKMRRQGLLPQTAVLLHMINARTGEEAMARHHQRMGYEAYKPMGEAQPCPNGCGGDYYPEGYGDCPHCGHIG